MSAGTGSDEPTYSRDELIAELDVSPEYAQRLWNAFGFAHRTTDDKIFTADEVAALRLFADSEGSMPQRAQVATARAIGQTMSRLTEWQADQITDLQRDPDVPWTQDQMINAIDVIQRLIWRRHLKLALERDATRVSDEEHDLVVGFADIVGYTSLSRRIGMGELEDLLEKFEERTFDIVTDRGGQVIKTLGDAVMFSFEAAGGAAAAALAIQRLSDADPIPPLRVGLARGPVLSRLGDLFGEPVNIAARLCGSARPGTILVDEVLAADLADSDRFYLRSMPSLSVRGYRRLRAKVLEPNKYYSRDSAAP
ncbi:adenylate/guanylate cyclase domain-containing protein [Gordonia sp. DT219]|uniref:adenylate/guanylate cyclase domain-containing protein n=1 Tax=Gordonia sp. DT219 TaxID=3416658 RepID=UPI003CF13200